MKIRFRYENTFQTLDVDLEEMWVMLSLNCEEGTPEKQREAMVQEAVDETFNRPEYNNYHRFMRHRDEAATPRRLDGKASHVGPPPLGVATPVENIELFPDGRNLDEFWAAEDYEEVSRKLHDALPERQANLLLSIHVDGIHVKEYAEAQGVSASSISHRLSVAEKNFKKIFPKPSTFCSSRGNHMRAIRTDKKRKDA